VFETCLYSFSRSTFELVYREANSLIAFPNRTFISYLSPTHRHILMCFYTLCLVFSLAPSDGSEKPAALTFRVNKLVVKNGLLELSVLFLQHSRSQCTRGLKASVCGHSLAGIVGPNPTGGGMDVCLFTVLCVVR